MIHVQAPLLSLRMKGYPVRGFSDMNYEDALERLSVLVEQERKYKCRDYLSRCKNSQHGTSQGSNESPTESEDTIDTFCREKMCEWSYRVCDHFFINREIVSFSFSILDRFVDRCQCDRAAFKLASMTSLYIATKIFDARQLPISSLAVLSGGEFEMVHIAAMERIILKTLEWRLNPPTVQAFITCLHVLLQIEDSELATAVYQRACFFAELCVFDYSLVTQDRCLVAVAALLNAFDAMDDNFLTRLVV